MMSAIRPVLLGGVLCLSACAASPPSNRQTIDIDTSPAGAICGLYRDGAKFAEIAQTPGNASVDIGPQAITVLCMKQGYHPALAQNAAKPAGTSISRNVLGGIGLGSAKPASTTLRYTDSLSLTLDPLPSGALAPEPDLPKRLDPAALLH